VAVVEMAIVTPVLLTLVFGIIEFGWIFMSYQTITNAAREGARTSTLQGTTDSDVQTRVHNYVQPAGLPQYAMSSVTDVSTVSGSGLWVRHEQGDCVETVVYSVPYADVSLIGLLSPGAFDLTATCSMRKEGCTVTTP
jgi:Flp pilus assembly protein TadG